MIKMTVETKKGKTTLTNGKIEGKPWDIAADIHCIVNAIVEACRDNEIVYGFLKHDLASIIDDEEEDGIQVSGKENEDVLDLLEDSLKEDEDVLDLLKDALKELKEHKKGEKK